MSDGLTGILDNARKNNSPLVVYGANCQLTEITLFALKAHGMEPDYLADGRLEYDGTKRRGLEVLSPDRLAFAYPDATVFICLTREFWTVRDMLWEKGMTGLYDATALLDTVTIEKPMFGQSAAFLRTARETHAQLVATRRGQVSLPFVNLILTERCTLNCRACNNMMPLVRDKRDYDNATLLAQARKLVDALDSAVSVHLIGGEPFLYKNLPALIRELTAFDKISQVEIVTNGTLLPKEAVLDAMAASPKAHITISEYPGIKQKTTELANLFDSREIPCDIGSFTEWRDLGEVAARGRAPAGIRNTFRDCAFKNCPTLLGGKLYRCSWSAFGTRLGLIPVAPAEYLDLDDSRLSATETRGQVKRLFIDAKALSACNFCNGGNVASPSITAAEQV